MKKALSFLLLFTALSASAGSGIDAMTIVLNHPQVDELEKSMAQQGYTLSKVVDLFAKRGFAPRGPYTTLELTFTKGIEGSGYQKESVFEVNAAGFNDPQVSIMEVK